MLSFLLRGSPALVMLRALAMIAAIAVADWRIEVNIPLGFLYLFPMLLVGSALNRVHIAAVATVCMFLTEEFDTYRWSPESGIPRDILLFSAFFGMGLFVYEMVRSRQLALRHLHQIENESAARRDAEEQLKVLVESSPAAIFTADSQGTVLLANDAAHRLLGLVPNSLPGCSLGPYLPSLVKLPTLQRQVFRTMMQCRGRRDNGEVFQADVWFSTYATSAGSRLAAMVVDSSEDLRTREEFSLHQLMAGSRILVGAVSHEIRNVCGAIAMVHANLARGEEALAHNKDFEALGTLIVALEKIAAMDLRQTANQASSVDLASFLEELRIVVEPSLKESGAEVTWEIAPNLPPVWADRHSLMHVFLNLTQNSERAMAKRPVRRLTMQASYSGPLVTVRVNDTGGGVTHPERLFRPFQQGAEATGLGLYLSREFLRSFRGEVRFEPVAGGASFLVELSAASPNGDNGNDEAAYPNSVGGRSQPVPGESQPAVAG